MVANRYPHLYVRNCAHIGHTGWVHVFRRLFAAQVIALTGTGLLTVALALLAYDLAGRSAGVVLGTVLAIKMLAYVFVAPVMAVLTDRYPSRAVLVSADGVRALVAMLLPFVGQTWQIYVLVFVLQAASATFTPRFQAIIPAVLPDEREYTRALSLSRLAYDLEALLSPALAAAALLVLSYSSLFLATAAGFVCSGIVVWRSELPVRPPPDRSGPWRGRVLVGIRTMLGRHELRALLAMNISVAAGTALVMVNTVVYVRDLLGGGDVAVGLTLAAYGAGSMAVALAMPRLLDVVADRTVMVSGAGGVAVALTLTAGMLAAGRTGPVLLALLWVGLGATTSMVTTVSGRLLARSGEHRTAVFTAQFSLSHAGFLLTYPIAGWVGGGVDQGLAAATLAILATGGAAMAARIIVRGRAEHVDGRQAGLAAAQSGARRCAGPATAGYRQ